MKKQLAAVTAMVILTSAIPSFTASAADSTLTAVNSAAGRGIKAI